MDDLGYKKKLEEVIQQYSGQIGDETRKLADQVLKNIELGMAVDLAVKKALQATSFFVANQALTIQALFKAVCAGYGISPVKVISSEKIQDKLLNISWAPDGMKLSTRLHGIGVRQNVVDAIQSSMRQQKSVIQLARKIYDGYASPDNKDALEKAKLPQYLDKLKSEARSLAREDKTSQKAFDNALANAKYNISKLSRGEAPTKALKAAYQSIVDAAEQLSEKALDTAVRVAVEERTRYYAERIARTESARAYFEGAVAKYEADDDVIGYRWTLSSRHKLLPFDICDVYANANFRLGKGVFPKGKVPYLPAHPHCLCSLVPIYKDEIPQSAKFDADGAREYIDSLSGGHRQMLFGIDGAKAYGQGESWTGLVRNFNGFREPDTRFDQSDFLT
jgi:hypothetical protein